MLWHQQGAALHTKTVQGQVLHNLSLPQPEAVHPAQQELAALSQRSSLETPLGGLTPIRPSQTNVLVLHPAWFFFLFFSFGCFSASLYTLVICLCASCLYINLASMWFLCWFAYDCQVLLLAMLPTWVSSFFLLDWHQAKIRAASCLLPQIINKLQLPTAASVLIEDSAGIAFCKISWPNGTPYNVNTQLL